MSEQNHLYIAGWRDKGGLGSWGELHIHSLHETPEEALSHIENMRDKFEWSDRRKICCGQMVQVFSPRISLFSKMKKALEWFMNPDHPIGSNAEWIHKMKSKISEINELDT